MAMDYVASADLPVWTWLVAALLTLLTMGAFAFLLRRFFF
jgi:hypothetical protein